MMRYGIMVICLAAALTACQEKVKEATNTGTVPPIFPDYVEVTIPAGIAPLNFDCKEETERMDVTVRGSLGGEMHVQGDYAAFDTDEWHTLTEANKGGKLTFSVCTKKDGKWYRYKDFDMKVSDHALDAYGLTYRRIAPGYEVYSSMGLYERELSTFKERALIENTQVPGMCVNCHMSNRTNPEQYVFHIRGQHGATLVKHNGGIELLAARNDSIKGSMVYPYWHPSGKYCAFSTNQTRQGFHTVKDERIEVFDLSSDVFVYDVEKHELLLDTLLMTTTHSENSPVFSADGKTLYYMTAFQQEYPSGYKQEQYNLCSIGFDPETGSFGNRADTVLNVVKGNKSLTWPRPSYDGKYIMYTLMDYGYFSIWHKESDLWMLDLETGKTYPLDGANSDDADSYHNWSADSRWFVFTSRREDGLYSYLYLSCIDDEGKASKPFLLPQKNPKAYYGKSLHSFNTPDFTARPVELDSRATSAAIESDKRVPTKVRLNGKRP